MPASRLAITSTSRPRLKTFSSILRSSLDEYGIPVEVARKLQSLLATEADLNATLENLRGLNLEEVIAFHFSG